MTANGLALGEEADYEEPKVQEFRIEANAFSSVKIKKKINMKRILRLIL